MGSRYVVCDIATGVYWGEWVVAQLDDESRNPNRRQNGPHIALHRNTEQRRRGPRARTAPTRQYPPLPELRVIRDTRRDLQKKIGAFVGG